MQIHQIRELIPYSHPGSSAPVEPLWVPTAESGGQSYGGAADKSRSQLWVEPGSGGLERALDDQGGSRSISLRRQTCPTICESDSWTGLGGASDLV